MDTGNKVPAIRFEGFSGEFNEEKLGDVCLIGDIDHRMPPSTNSGIPYLMTGDFFGINSLDFENAKLISVEDYEALSRKIKPEKDDILFARYASVGAVRYVETDAKFTISYSCAILKNSSESHSSKYLYYYLQSTKVQYQIELEINTGSQRNIGIDSLKKLCVISPTHKEQLQISHFLSGLDTLIAQHQKKHDKLLNLKKALLEKLFSKQGATEPELRFRGFSGEWEEKCLGELCKETYGGGTPRTSISEYWIGDIPWIQSSDLVEGKVINIDAKKRISISGVKNSATKLIPEESIAIVTRVGVGKISLMQQEYATSQDFLSLSKLKVTPLYGVYSIWKMLQKEKLGVQGTSIKGITKEELLSKVINVPINDMEQTKIGNLFKQLDTLITQHQAQLKKLNNVKQACLEKMFV